VTTGTLTYRPQLDGLRAVAVMAVLFTHFWHLDSGAGRMGVRLFFVLSGYLITSILLRDGLTLSFYVRRAARLWPAFYLALLIAWGLDLNGIRWSWKWHAAQLSNVFLARHGSWAIAWPIDHLWSLNVEEQFYLVWPILIALTPRRLIVALLWLIGLTAPIYRSVVGNEFTNLLPFASLDALAAGGLIAVASRRLIPHIRDPGDGNFKFTALGWIGAAASPLVVRACFGPASPWLSEVIEVGSLVSFCALVLKASEGFSGLTGKVLGSPLLIGLGKISYGVYLYHQFVKAAFFHFGWPYHNGPLTFLACGATTILVAWLSYHCLEHPLREAVSRGTFGTRSAQPS
jgi:peptidoglycan/LPS O-acetylase OafA/YrhL